MFWASSCPSSGATTTAVAASGLPLELGDSSAVGRGRANHKQQHCYHQDLTVNQRLLLQLRSCCILLVDSVENNSTVLNECCIRAAIIGRWQ